MKLLDGEARRDGLVCRAGSTEVGCVTLRNEKINGLENTTQCDELSLKNWSSAPSLPVELRDFYFGPKQIPRTQVLTTSIVVTQIRQQFGIFLD